MLVSASALLAPINGRGMAWNQSKKKHRGIDVFYHQGSGTASSLSQSGRGSEPQNLVLPWQSTLGEHSHAVSGVKVVGSEDSLHAGLDACCEEDVQEFRELDWVDGPEPESFSWL